MKGAKLIIYDGSKTHLIDINTGYVILKKSLWDGSSIKTMGLSILGWFIRRFCNIYTLIHNFAVGLIHVVLDPTIQPMKFSIVNHGGVFRKSASKGWVSIDAKGRGVVETRVSDELKNNYYIILEPTYNEYSPKKCDRRILSDLDKPYDLLSLFVWQVIKQTFGIWLGKRGERASDRIYCTEQVARTHLEAFSEPSMVDPEDVYRNEHFKPIYEGKIVWTKLASL
jgi:hypothetical protein